MTQLTYRSPAKINLFLHLTGRRADGYHELQTLFQLIDFCDELSFACRDEPEIVLNDNTGIAAADNIVTRAATLLQQTSGSKQGALITLDKKIPMGAGLGGGSSNAATTLFGLNELWGLCYGIIDLLPLAEQLGADVPVFVQGASALAEGTGEELYEVELPESWYLILIPPVHVSTAEIYAAADLTRDTPAESLEAMLEWDSDKLLNFGHNDMQAVVESRFPEVKQAITWLSAFAPARMSGSGCAVFARFESKEEAEKLLPTIPQPLTGFVAEGINLSPLFG